MSQAIRKLRVVHTTTYAYDRPVERSVHKLHLCPIHDWDQEVLSHTLAITPTLASAPPAAAGRAAEDEDDPDSDSNLLPAAKHQPAPYAP
jgi:Bacterial transglutaminase-like N-terminal region